MHVATVALLAIASGCIGPASDEDGAFYDWDERTVHCAVGLDDITQIDHASIDAALDRARDRGEVVELYAHSFERSVAASTIEHVLAGASERGLRFVTYGELARGAVEPGPALALSFDDNQTQTWIDMRDLLARHGARVTFFVSRYARITDEQRAHIRLLAMDGHGIEAHSVAHLRAPRYVEDHGLAAYLSDEALPSIELLRTDGYDVTTYAYPFGARTAELDDALLAHVTLLRSISFTFRAATSPCP